jgi:hypothetical protein
MSKANPALFATLLEDLRRRDPQAAVLGMLLIEQWRGSDNRELLKDWPGSWVGVRLSKAEVDSLMDIADEFLLLKGEPAQLAAMLISASFNYRRMDKLVELCKEVMTDPDQADLTYTLVSRLLNHRHPQAFKLARLVRLKGPEEAREYASACLDSHRRISRNIRYDARHRRSPRPSFARRLHKHLKRRP